MSQKEMFLRQHSYPPAAPKLTDTALNVIVTPSHNGELTHFGRFVPKKILVPDLELAACTPDPLAPRGFNPSVVLPYDLTTAHIKAAMQEFLSFLEFINLQLRTREIPRLERFLMPANFSSLVGEFMNISIPKYCLSLVKNNYHNGHPDLIPASMFPKNAVQYAHEGIEIKGSRYARGWQGHNPEAIWLMVFSFEANSANDVKTNLPARPFRFAGVFAAKLELEDWTYSGRSSTSRRTITASVNPRGMAKMQANWIYKVSSKTAALALPSVEDAEG